MTVDDAELKYEGRFTRSSLSTPKLPLSHTAAAVEKGWGEGDSFVSEWFSLTASGFYF